MVAFVVLLVKWGTTNIRLLFLSLCSFGALYGWCSWHLWKPFSYGLSGRSKKGNYYIALLFRSFVCVIRVNLILMVLNVIYIPSCCPCLETVSTEVRCERESIWSLASTQQPWFHLTSGCTMSAPSTGTLAAGGLVCIWIWICVWKAVEVGTESWPWAEEQRQRGR